MTLRLPNPLAAVAWFAFLVPGTILGGRLDFWFAIAVFALAALILAAQPAPWETGAPAREALKLFIALELAWLVSYLYSAAFNGIPVGPRDFAELPRFILLGAFVVYVIRHYDRRANAAVETGMIAAVYLSLAIPAIDPQGYVSLLALCLLLFFSRAKIRHAHAAVALVAVILHGGAAARLAAVLTLGAALALRYARRYYKPAAWSFGALFLASAMFLAHAAPSVGQSRFFRASPFFGWGPAQYEALPSRLGQFSLWLLRGGLLGEALILLGLALATYRLLRAACLDSARLAGAAVFVGSVALTLLSGPVMEGYRLFFVTSLCVAGIHEACR